MSGYLTAKNAEKRKGAQRFGLRHVIVSYFGTPASTGLVIRLKLWRHARHNPACKQMYDRLVHNGKADKLAIIAVANKLLKQAFAVVTNKKTYQPEYYSALNPKLS